MYKTELYSTRRYKNTHFQTSMSLFHDNINKYSSNCNHVTCVKLESHFPASHNSKAVPVASSAVLWFLIVFINSQFHAKN